MMNLIKYLLRVSTERTCLVVVGGTYASSMMGRDANVNGRLSDSTESKRGIDEAEGKIKLNNIRLDIKKFENSE